VTELARPAGASPAAPGPKKAAAKKAAATKDGAKKAPAKKSPAKKSPAKKSPAKKAPAKKHAAKKAAAKKAGAKAARPSPGPDRRDEAASQSRSEIRRPALAAPPTDPMLVLGVQPGWTLVQLRHAWRDYAGSHHPDRGGDPATFARGKRAYDALRRTSR
jgi:cobalamin biosynthesis Mg chelatase CobN